MNRIFLEMIQIRNWKRTKQRLCFSSSVVNLFFICKFIFIHVFRGFKVAIRQDKVRILAKCHRKVEKTIEMREIDTCIQSWCSSLTKTYLCFAVLD